jgi:2-polyprenyl-6-methoxyphenol hydroxylase-like FAD-dependent oxidoreductase
MGALNVAIVGAGIGGLTAAIALRRRAVNVAVYEQAHELRELGAGVTIGANGARVYDSLGLRDRLVVVVAVEDEAVPAPGEDVEDIGRPDLELLRASEAKNCELLIEILDRMDEVCDSCHQVF